MPVWAYTNGDAAELFLNGESFGKQTIPAYGNAAWDVPYQSGTVLVIAYRDGKEIARAQQVTAGAPVSLQLVSDHAQLAADRDACTRIEVTAVDADGVAVPWASNAVQFHAVGPQRFMGAENGDRLDFTAPRSTTRRLYFGKMAAFYGALDSNDLAGAEDEDNAAIIVTAAALLGDRYGEAGRAVQVAVNQLALRGVVPAANLTMTYTTDGSQPTEQSPAFPSAGLTIDQTTQLQVLVRDGDEIFAEICEEFIIGERPIQAMAAGHNQDDDQAIDGVRDVEAQGWWENPQNGQRYELKADGSVHQMTAVGIPDRVGQWWYDYPNDRDEDPDDHGTGEIVWGRGKQAPLAMASEPLKSCSLVSLAVSGRSSVQTEVHNVASNARILAELLGKLFELTAYPPLCPRPLSHTHANSRL